MGNYFTSSLILQNNKVRRTRMRKSWKRIVAAGLAAVTMCTSVNLQAFAEDGTILSAEAKWDGVTMTNSYEGDGYTVTYTLSGYWEGGYNASIRIDNVSQEAIHNWYLRVDSEKDLFNIWNGSIYEETETGYVIKNAGWIMLIQPILMGMESLIPLKNISGQI